MYDKRFCSSCVEGCTKESSAAGRTDYDYGSIVPHPAKVAAEMQSINTYQQAVVLNSSCHYAGFGVALIAWTFVVCQKF